jgi:acetylcholinesterase
LFLNVWSPTGATPDSKLPVWVYIQGGGYNTNSNANYNGSEVVNTSGQSIVFVNFNYRVASWGFLASEKVRENGDLNVGLLDQRLVLKWVQEHISKVSFLFSSAVANKCSSVVIQIMWWYMECLLVGAR